jgi:hypothetical protein
MPAEANHIPDRRATFFKPSNRRQVFQPVQAMGLKAPLPVVEAGPVDPAAPAGLGDVVQPLGQFQHRQSSMCQLLVGVLGHHLAGCFGHDRSSQSAAWISPGRKTRRLRRHVTYIVHEGFNHLLLEKWLPA